ncbi:MAG: mercuric reductase [Candidatus Dormibacteraeota bacterium]|nr:mercuric reductase [Candidatus Dormibacteraeota bacterium]
MSENRYDAIVIGSGQGGGPLSTALAEAGWRTAIVERDHVGGTCINDGCTPTKTMVASARVAYLARRGADYGVRTGPIGVDMGRVRQRKRDIVESFRSGSEHALTAAKGLDLVRGEARFLGPETISVELVEGGSRRLSAGTIVINTGARPSRPALPGLDLVPSLDSTSIMELDVVPERLLVLGGGYIGLEFGQMFRRFGSAVTIVQRGPALMAREDPDVAGAVAKIMIEDGIEVLLDATASEVASGPGGRIQLTVESKAGRRVLDGTHLLLAAGRAPNSDRLDLPAAGIATEGPGFVRVDEQLRTGVPGIYAIGDVKGGPAFTHISYDDFRILRQNLLGAGGAGTRDRLVPYTMFIDPQLGRVGLTETEARAKGGRVLVAKMPMDNVARALEMDETRGFMKAVVDADTGQIRGCAVLGVEGGEIMAAIQMAMMGKVPYTVLRDAVFAHPTLAESLNNLFGSVA